MSIQAQQSESSHPDSTSQKFLNNQLQIAETNGEYAWIIAHVSPSDTACGRNWSNSFSSIVKRYQETIAAQFYGRTLGLLLLCIFALTPPPALRRHAS